MKKLLSVIAFLMAGCFPQELPTDLPGGSVQNTIQATIKLNRCSHFMASCGRAIYFCDSDTVLIFPTGPDSTYFFWYFDKPELNRYNSFFLTSDTTIEGE